MHLVHSEGGRGGCCHFVERSGLFLSCPVSLYFPPLAAGLDEDSIDTHFDIEESIVSPCTSPGVTYDPCLNSIDDSPPYDTDIVVNF